MSKSIYEEALEIMINSFLPRDYFNNTNKLKIMKALEKAEKQEKLLELYRKLSVIRNDLLSYCEVVDDDYDDFEYIEIDLEKEIKELENESN